LFVLAQAYAQKEIIVPFTLADRDRLIRLEARIDALEKRIDALEKRIDALEKQLDSRFAGIERQIDALYNLFIALFSAFVALVVGTMGMLWWVVQDRRKTIRPLEDSVEEHRRLVSILKKRALTNPDLAALLEEAGIALPKQ
ncbi:MAG: hypothetical protein RMK98_08465, partial [Bacteroidia bacterium]|nr:hypothetical protein [Bacteroidia bacterium]